MSTPPAKEPHYTKIGEWVSECGANGMEAAAYQHLAKRLNHSSGSRCVDPSRARLAADLGLKKLDDVDPYLRALEALGAIVIHARKGMRTKYELPLWPPEGYDGPANTYEADKWQKADPEGYAAWRARRRSLVEAAEAPYAAKRRARVAKSTAKKRTTQKPDVPVVTGRSDEGDVPVATGTHQPVVTGHHLPVATGTNQDGPNDQTNMGDGRQASTGSRRRGSSGSAASDKQSDPDDKPKPSALRAVVEGIPGPLMQLLEKECPRGLPHRISQLIEDGLVDEHRTPSQLTERMARRWQVFGYENALLSQSGEGIRRSIGVLEELLAPSKCRGNNIDCEDGVELYTNRACPRCEEERQVRQGSTELAADLEQQEASETYTAPQYVPPPREGAVGVNEEMAKAARAALLQSRSLHRR